MLSPSEQRRYSVQRRRMATLRSAAAQLQQHIEETDDAFHKTILRHDLEVLNADIEALGKRMPIGDVSTLFDTSVYNPTLSYHH